MRRPEQFRKSPPRAQLALLWRYVRRLRLAPPGAHSAQAPRRTLPAPRIRAALPALSRSRLERGRRDPADATRATKGRWQRAGPAAAPRSVLTPDRPLPRRSRACFQAPLREAPILPAAARASRCVAPRPESPRAGESVLQCAQSGPETRLLPA